MKNNRLKELRTKNKLSLTQLSKLVNIDVSRLSKFENNQVGLRDKNLKALSNYFNVTIAYLLNLDESIDNTTIERDDDNLKIKYIIKSLDGMRDDDLTLLIEIIKRLKA